MTPDLETLPDELPEQIDELIRSAILAAEGVDEIGEPCEQVSESYRALACARLLVHADSDGFHDDLIRSAMTRVYYLRQCKVSNFVAPDTATSRSGPLMDALAADAFDVAAEIADLSLTDWLKDDEYEDDFCHAEFLQGLVTSSQALDPILARFEAAVGGAASPRLGVCRALATADQSEFDTAFAELITEREVEVADEKDRYRYCTPYVLVNQLVFVEGLALLRLATNAGLETKTEYLYCPALARAPRTRPNPVDGYPTLP